MKRTQPDGAVPAVRPALARAGSSTLVEAEHPELPLGASIRLRPRVVLDSAGKVAKIEISGRTPSPFGGAMGDHTVSWQALVDAVHADLHGLLLATAISVLRAEHEARTEWMRTAGSDGMLLLRELDDI